MSNHIDTRLTKMVVDTKSDIADMQGVLCCVVCVCAYVCVHVSCVRVCMHACMYRVYVCVKFFSSNYGVVNYSYSFGCF